MKIGPEPQLLVDDSLIARKTGIARKAHACKKLPEPVLVPENPWEGDRVYTYGTVLYDREQRLFRMWYMSRPDERAAIGRDPKLNRSTLDLVLYATSEDGIHWERPSLGQYTFGGSRDNNIVFDLHSPSIIHDPGAADPSGAYKMIGVRSGQGYWAACSSDGLRWTDYPKNPILPSSDTCTLAGNPGTGEYLAFHKRTHTHRGHNRRLIYLATSPDMQTWSEPVLALAPDATDDGQTAAENGLYSQFYNMSVFPRGGQFLGLVTHFRYAQQFESPAPGQSGHDGPIDVQLTHSRNGRTWHRCADRSPVIPNGPYAYDAGCILGTANTPVFVDDEMWIYYTAITTTHGGPLPEKRITIARAAWRLDGLVSLSAGNKPGVAETVPLHFSGDRLSVNANAKNGSLAVRVLNERGKSLPGYSLADCIPLRADAVRHAVRWKDHSHIPTDHPVRLCFHLENARLFSYTVGHGERRKNQ